MVDYSIARARCADVFLENIKWSVVSSASPRRRFSVSLGP